MKLLVIDTETSGTEPDKHSILSLGAVIWNSDPALPVDTFEVFVSESKIVADEQAMKVNKIDLGWLNKNGKTPMGAVSLFYNFLRKHWKADEKINLAGHCVDFDVQFLKRLFRIAGYQDDYAKIFTHRTIDTSGIGRYLVMAGKLELEPKSDALFDYFGIDPGEARHTALGDALATSLLLHRLVEFIRVS